MPEMAFLKSKFKRLRMSEYLTKEQEDRCNQEAQERLYKRNASVEAHIREDENKDGSVNDRTFRFPVQENPNYFSTMNFKDDKPLAQFRQEIDKILERSPDATMGKVFSWMYAASHGI